MALTPLVCPSCHGPTPLADAEATTCGFCGTRVPIPAEYRELLLAQRQYETAAARAPLWKELGRPPAWLLRALSEWFSPLALAVFFFAASPLIGMALVGASGVAFSRAMRIDPFEVYSDLPWNWASVVLGFVFVWTGALFGVAGTRRALALGPLQAALAAKPPDRPGGRAACRRCGAPLTYGGKDLGVRCAYCQADNLLRLPAAWVERMKEAARASVLELAEVETAWATERTRLKRYRWKMVVGLTIPTLLFTLMFRDTFKQGPVGPWSWSWERMRAERAVRLYTADKPANQPYWYSDKRTVTPDELGRIVTQTTGPHCSSDRCLVSLDFPAKRGERWSVYCSPIAARVVVHEVALMGPSVMENWQKGWPGPFEEAPLAVGTCGGLVFESTWSGFLRAVVQVQGGEPERQVDVWVSPEPLPTAGASP